MNDDKQNKILFGKGLKLERELHCLTQDEFAEKLGLTRSSVSNVECGDASFGEETMKKVCAILNTTYPALVDFGKNKYNPTGNVNISSRRIGEEMRKRGWNTEAMSKKSGISIGTLRSYLYAYRYPSSRSLILISKALNISPRELLAENILADQDVVNKSTVVEKEISVSKIEDSHMTDRLSKLNEKVTALESKIEILTTLLSKLISK
jgi:transcriptional regulator with XRE-family HTH domain